MHGSSEFWSSLSSTRLAEPSAPRLLLAVQHFCFSGCASPQSENLDATTED